MSYLVTISPGARKAMRKVPKPLRVRIDAAILALEREPRPHGSLKLQGQDLYRIRVGDYRIVYSIDDAGHIVIVVVVGHRRDVYREVD